MVQGDDSGCFDLPLLKRALSNLLSNACRYASPASTVEIHIRPLGQEKVRLTVRNFGADIAPQDLPRIFDRLYRSDAARSQPSAHHGLGLSIVAAVARMHQGHTVASSTAGQTEIGLVLQKR